jgi:hypothetical protein
MSARNIAIRHRDSVKLNEENAFTRDRVHSTLGFALSGTSRRAIRHRDKSIEQRSLTA